jgi:hypothetical protein
MTKSFLIIGFKISSQYILNIECGDVSDSFGGLYVDDGKVDDI